VYNSLVIAHQKFIFNKSLGLYFAVLHPCLNVAVLLCGTGSIGLVAVTTVLNIVMVVVKTVYCFRTLGVRPQMRNIDFSPLRAIFQYSIFIFIAEISNMLYSSTDKMFLGVYCGTAIVSVYSVGSALQAYYCAFSTTISNVLFPKINSLVANNASDQELSDAFIKYGRIQYLLMCLITTGFILFGKQFITQFWGGAGYVDAYYVALITMLPSLIPLIQNVGPNIVQAKSKHQFRTLCLFCIAVANLVFSWLLVRRYGMIGCTLPTGISYLLGQGVAMNWFYWKKMNIDIPAFWKNIGRMTLPVLPLFFMSGVVIRWVGVESRITLLAGIAIYTVLYLVIAWKFVANDFERGLVRKKYNGI
jgi:O-antigen/teichoic acid export membrane protein